MKTISSLKRWLTLTEAGAACMTLLRTTVQETDFLQLGLDDLLQLSVVFSEPVLATPFHLKDAADIEYRKVPSLSGEGHVMLPIGGEVVQSRDGSFFQSSGENLVQLVENSPFDLSMIGGERADVEQALWDALGVAREPTFNLDGTFLTDGLGAERRLLRLMGVLTSDKGGARSYYPIGRLPDTALVVVRGSALEGLTALLRGDVEQIQKGSTRRVQSDAVPKPLQRQRAQELSILATLHDLGISPQSVPIPAPGLPSDAKTRVREALGYTPDVMNKAWQRLRSAGSIRDAEP